MREAPGREIILEGVVQRAVERAVLGGELGRREFIRRVGARVGGPGLGLPGRCRHRAGPGRGGAPREARSQDRLHPDHLILSAIDFVVKLEKKGERGLITIDAKFLHH